jgi:putative acetyltransferase
MQIRPETPDDFDEIDEVVRAAFKSNDEVKIVRDIRAGTAYAPELSLVAIDQDAIVGHVMLSYQRIDDRRVLQLAPLAVRPDRQRMGIGDALTRAVLTLADAEREPLCLVLGHPEYYPRFGFGSARALGIEPDVPDLPDDVWMVKRLTHYDASIRGTAHFEPTGS